MRDRWALKEAAYKALGNAYASKHSRSDQIHSKYTHSKLTVSTLTATKPIASTV